MNPNNQHYDGCITMKFKDFKFHTRQIFCTACHKTWRELITDNNLVISLMNQVWNDHMPNCGGYFQSDRVIHTITDILL
jgi:lipopolysaccharide biosynthesis glycosyltransferase